MFTVGFSLYLANKEDDDTLKEISDNKSPLYFPYYMTLVGGQFVAVLGLLHAALPLGLPSYIVGALSTILNTIYFASVGYVINTSHYDIQDLRWYSHYYHINDHDSRLVRAVRLMLAGSIILAVSWGLVQLLSSFYERSPQSVPARNLWCVVVECVRNRTTVVSDVSESVRLSIIPVMVLSAVGWGVFIGGQYYRLIWSIDFFGRWSATFIPPLMYLAALLHAGYTEDASTLMGIFASILNTFFVVGMGFSVTLAGKYLYTSSHSDTNSQDTEDDPYLHFYRLMLGGGMICLIFWTIVLVLWPFYRFKGTSHTNETNNSDYDHDLLLPGAASPTEHTITESRENIQRPGLTFINYHPEAEAANV